MSDGSRVVQEAEAADAAIRSINHITITGAVDLPAPVVYNLLGHLQSAGGYGLAQALRQIATGLGRSLGTHDVYEDDGRDPVQSVAKGVDALTEAAELAGRVGALLSTAQNEIAGQGHRPRNAGGEDH